MSSPQIVVLDTRDATDKASFLVAVARDLGFPAYFGHNWDAFEECARDFADERRPVLVVWTGAAGLPADVRDTAVEILDASFQDGADVVIVDAVQDEPQPDFAVAQDRVAIPIGGLPAAQEFWRTIGLQVAGHRCEGDAVLIELVEVDTFHPGIGPVMAVASLAGLVRRLLAADHGFVQNETSIEVFDPHGTLITFIPY